MKTMTMPGFTADASLVATRGLYGTAGMGAAPDGSGTVVPQFSWCYYTYVGLNMNPMKRCCYCDEYGGGCVCRTVGGHTLFPPDGEPTD
jgi:hypothetical protein